ncbi:hypothetical protein J6590_069609 [Homalodisca vitripennis]|nr:hypothetical protein J6590_069609 [Homalodisca vitripennis]
MGLSYGDMQWVLDVYWRCNEAVQNYKGEGSRIPLGYYGRGVSILLTLRCFGHPPE